MLCILCCIPLFKVGWIGGLSSKWMAVFQRLTTWRTCNPLYIHLFWAKRLNFQVCKAIKRFENGYTTSHFMRDDSESQTEGSELGHPSKDSQLSPIQVDEHDNTTKSTAGDNLDVVWTRTSDTSLCKRIKSNNRPTMPH